MGLAVAAQTPSDSADVTFDVVSIRQSAKDGKGIYLNWTPSGIYTARNLPVSVLISQAYRHGLTIIGAPDWLDSAEFDISAKSEIPKPGMHRQQMLKSLLADRFQFAAHFETREQLVYFLVKARSDGRLGSLLRPAKGCDRSAPVNAPPAGRVTLDELPTCSSMYGSTRQSVGNMPLAALIHNLPRSFIDRPVLDRTGLTGNFDWDLRWENDPTGASTGVSIFSALQEQLGLKLEPGRGPVEVLVIDRVEKPVLD